MVPVLQDPVSSLGSLTPLLSGVLCPGLSSPQWGEQKTVPETTCSSLISACYVAALRGGSRAALVSFGKVDSGSHPAVIQISPPRSGFIFLLESSAEAASPGGSED